jgi:hypothetical protein
MNLQLALIEGSTASDDMVNFHRLKNKQFATTMRARDRCHHHLGLIVSSTAGKSKNRRKKNDKDTARIDRPRSAVPVTNGSASLV